MIDFSFDEPKHCMVIISYGRLHVEIFIRIGIEVQTTLTYEGNQYVTSKPQIKNKER